MRSLTQVVRLRIKYTQMLKEIDSIPEILFYATNYGVIVIGIYFLVRSKKFISKILLSSPFLLLYVFLPVLKGFGCKYGWLSEATCREWGWFYVMIPPIVFMFCFFELVVYKIYMKKMT